MAPATLYQIGNGTVDGTDVFKFVNGSGSVPEPQNRIQRLAQPGVVWARYRNLGEGGTPFQVRTVRDTVSILTGRVLVENYVKLCGADLQKFVWKSADYDSVNLRVAVISVTVNELRNIACWSNAFDDNNSFARLDCTWQLEFRSLV